MTRPCHILPSHEHSQITTRTTSIEIHLSIKIRQAVKMLAQWKSCIWSHRRQQRDNSIKVASLYIVMPQVISCWQEAVIIPTRPGRSLLYTATIFTVVCSTNTQLCFPPGTRCLLVASGQIAKISLRLSWLLKLKDVVCQTLVSILIQYADIYIPCLNFIHNLILFFSWPFQLLGWRKIIRWRSCCHIFCILVQWFHLKPMFYFWAIGIILWISHVFS
jgi:hypothetical protein